MTDKERLELIYEDINLNRKNKRDIEIPNEGNTVRREDLTNFIFANTNGGTENFTVWTIRRNDSKTDPTKKAGDEMVINGMLKIPPRLISGIGSPLGGPKEKYDTYNLLGMYVSSINGVNYLTKFPNAKDRIRNFSVGDIFKLRINRETYNVI